MNYISLVIAVLLMVGFIYVMNSEIDGKMTGTAGLGKAIMALLVGGLCLVVSLLHLGVIILALVKGNALSVVYIISVIITVIPVIVLGFMILFKR